MTDHLMALAAKPLCQAKRLLYRWASQVGWLLEFEPTWFPEFGFAIGAVGWGLGGLFTNDIHVAGAAYVLPVVAIALGLVRGMVLLRLWYSTRVVLASASAALWLWIWWSLAGRFGLVPIMGLLAGAFVIEMLTAARFSLPCAREVWRDYLAWHEGRA